jgi:hypothetical protein
MTSFSAAAFGERSSSATSAGDAVLRFGGTTIAVGSFGVVLSSVFYALSPAAAALPAQPFNEAAALAGAVSGAGVMHWAGAIGIFADIAFAMGCLLAMLSYARRERAMAAAGWATVALSQILFIVVDAVAGFTLAPLAASPATIGAFIGFKTLFDALFLLATFTFGLGAAFSLWPEVQTSGAAVSKPLAYAGLAVGALAMIAALACFAGIPFQAGVGLAIAAGSVVFTLVGWQIAKDRGTDLG